MRPLDRAFEDIKLAVKSDIVHKYLLSNAPDMVAIAQLATTCRKYDESLFGWVAAIAHVMVNPRVIIALSGLIEKHKGDKTQIMAEIMEPAAKERWNTLEFHAEMKAVSSGYQNHGGYQAGNINAGVASEFFSTSFSDRFIQLSQLIQSWLYYQNIVREDDLIQGIFALQVPGMYFDAKKMQEGTAQEKAVEKSKEYWLLHFCRWISFARNTALNLPIIESHQYLDMIGVQIFRDHYKVDGHETLTLADMPALFQRTKEFITDFERSQGRSDPKFTYGDFGCLACETHRMLDQLAKELHCNESAARTVLQERLATSDDIAGWLKYKAQNTDLSKGPSIVDSARYNCSLFASALHEAEAQSKNKFVSINAK